MIGLLKVTSRNDISFAEIVQLNGEETIAGVLRYKSAIAESYDILPQDPIDNIEIDFLIVDAGIEYSTDVSVIDREFQFYRNCTVITFE